MAVSVGGSGDSAKEPGESTGASSNQPRVVGLTGGIASGKSTVARQFEQLGVPSVDADQLAREVVAKGSVGLAAIVEAFGVEVLLQDGNLDRKAMGQKVFSDPIARAKLNAITHPRIASLGAERVRALAQKGVPYVLYEAALIVENGLHRGMGALVVVSADAATQRTRIMQRDLLSLAEAEARIAAQAPLEKKLAVADFVIDNSQVNVETLGERVREVHQALLSRFGGRTP
ncbi:MAG: dephospho-CoA kinase [Myxococcales bacterium]